MVFGKICKICKCLLTASEQPLSEVLGVEIGNESKALTRSSSSSSSSSSSAELELTEIAASAPLGISTGMIDVAITLVFFFAVPDNGACCLRRFVAGLEVELLNKSSKFLKSDFEILVSNPSIAEFTIVEKFS